MTDQSKSFEDTFAEKFTGFLEGAAPDPAPAAADPVATPAPEAIAAPAAAPEPIADPSAAAPIPTGAPASAPAAAPVAAPVVAQLDPAMIAQYRQDGAREFALQMLAAANRRKPEPPAPAPKVAADWMALQRPERQAGESDDEYAVRSLYSAIDYGAQTAVAHMQPAIEALRKELDQVRGTLDPVHARYAEQQEQAQIERFNNLVTGHLRTVGYGDAGADEGAVSARARGYVNDMAKVVFASTDTSQWGTKEWGKALEPHFKAAREYFPPAPTGAPTLSVVPQQRVPIAGGSGSGAPPAPPTANARTRTKDMSPDAIASSIGEGLAKHFGVA